MPDREDHTAYFQTYFKRNWSTVLLSALGALGLTLVMFLTLPFLNTFSGNSSLESPANRRTVIQPRREKAEVEPEVVETPELPEPRLLEPEKKPRSVYNKPEIHLATHLEVNMKHLESPGILLLSTFDTVSMTADWRNSGVFSEGQLDRPLMTLVRAPPVYPIQARRQGIEGSIKVLLTVDEEGNVTETAILDADPSGIFEKSVERCVSRWRFKPGTVDGEPVKALFETTIEFKLASG